MSRRGRILGCGTVLLAALTAASLLDGRASSGIFVILMSGAGLAYLAALREIAHGKESRTLLKTCVLIGVAGRMVMIPNAPLVSDDAYRYVWDGRVQRFGHNPYTSAPDDPALAPLHTDVTRRIDPVSAALPTIYPPAAVLVFRAVTAVHESVTALAVIVVLCDLLTSLVLWRWLVATDRDPWWVIAYLWHPLVVLEGAGGGHIDLVGTMLVVTAAFALTRRRTSLACAALAVSVAVKYLPVVLGPLLWRRVRVRDAAIGAVIVAGLYLPFVGGETGMPVGSLGTYAEHWRFNGPIFSWLEPWLGSAGGLGLAVAGGLVVAALARQRLPVSDPRGWAWPMATVLLLMPAVYPWYLVWLVPFLTTRGTWPLTAWTLACVWTYLVWANERAGVGWVLPGWVVVVEYAIVALTALEIWRRHRRPVPDGASV